MHAVKPSNYHIFIYADDLKLAKVMSVDDRLNLQNSVGMTKTNFILIRTNAKKYFRSFQ